MRGIDRRHFLHRGAMALGGGLAATALAPPALKAAGFPAAVQSKPDYTLKIEPCSIEIAPGVVVKTTAYNGQVPGPLLRLREGVPVTIDVTNASANPDIVHWHGLAIDSLNDGAMEEGSPMIAPGGQLRYTFTPRPAGTRWYHTHAGAGGDLTLGTYSGQFGFLLVEGKPDPGHYDQEIFLAIHHWGAVVCAHGGDDAGGVGESAADYRIRCGLSVRDHEPAHAGRGRADPREAGAAGADAAAERERDGKCGAGAAGAYVQGDRDGRQPGAESDGGGGAFAGRCGARGCGGGDECARRVGAGIDTGGGAQDGAGHRGGVCRQDGCAGVDRSCAGEVGLHAVCVGCGGAARRTRRLR